VNEVGQKIAAHSARSHLPYEFVVINSSVPNAWALPGGKIAINRGLLVELENEAELAAVLGHEIVHADARHTARSIHRSRVAGGIVAGVGILLGASSDNKYSGLALGLGALGASLILQKYGREAELEADLYGTEYMVKAGYDPHGAVTLQEKFVALSEGRQSNWLEGLFASHPPSQERVERNKLTANRLGGVGDLGESRYKQKMARLLKSGPAYEDHDEGVQAIKETQFDQALSLANSAIGLEPREAIFYELKGDALLGKKNTKAALAEYQSAIERNPDYFIHHLSSGLTKKQLGNRQGAQQDLTRSISLLPTAVAHEALGDIAAEQGRRQEAINHYSVAAQSNSPAGQRAAQKLERLRTAN
ncbi:MAG: M48 family metalloprotease, partial [Gammaproteobacteria bacterium]|nr:M48 family metalloprotease [Gammaproteobacteria bacterium]